MSLFNLLYKHYEAVSQQCNVDDISGIDALLLRLEYGADTQLGRRACDIGASFSVIEYYDTKEKYPDGEKRISDLYNKLDDFEKDNVNKLNSILY